MEMKNRKTPAVSVIIPMYNVEKIIDRCLQSILAQQLPDFEVVFVDDKSTDGTVGKVSRWMSEHADASFTCRLIRHEANQGVATARNTGLDNAIGEYIYYVDTDDYIEPDTLSTLYSEAVEKEADIVGCEWYLSFKQNERHIGQPEASTGEEAFKKMAKGRMRWNLWLFLVKRSLYETHHFRFIPKMNMGEDMMVMMKMALCAGRVSIIHRPLYHYIQVNENSLTKYFQDSRHQVTANVKELESYLHQIGRTDLMEYIRLLQLSVKLPLLISPKKKDYKLWQGWFPEANSYIEKNDENPFYTMLIQKAARGGHFWFLRLYYWGVIKILYGLIYK